MHHIPYKRLSVLCGNLFNFEIGEETIENTLETGYQKGMPIVKKILKRIKTYPWIGTDETGVKINGKNWWQWVWQNTIGAYFVIAKGRGLGIVDKYFGHDYLGILVHDCLAAHNNTLTAGGHQLCLVHIFRDLIFDIEFEHQK